VIIISLKLKDIIENLESRGRVEEADFYKLLVPFELGLIHGLTEREVLKMTVDEIEGWYQTPPKPAKYHGWNSFYWGKAIEDADNR